jgi:hypothetical protein
MISDQPPAFMRVAFDVGKGSPRSPRGQRKLVTPSNDRAALGSPFSSASRNLAAELTSLMQDVIVDTTGALYAAGQRIVGPRLGLNGVVHIYESPPSSPCGVRPVLVGPGRGVGGFRAAPFLTAVPVRQAFERWLAFAVGHASADESVGEGGGARPKPPPRPFPGGNIRATIAKVQRVAIDSMALLDQCNTASALYALPARAGPPHLIPGAGDFTRGSGGGTNMNLHQRLFVLNHLK